ncbi:MAG TPA: enoyl-CoA hydratase/isomerase family protein [Steroidobacteraceae bacterium]
MQLHSSVERIGAVAVVRFDNPPSGLIASKGAAHLADTIETLFGDSSVRTLVITGAAPGVFIRHADVAQIVRAGEALAAERIGIEDFLASPFVRLTRLCEMAPIPVIAAIDGVCMGGGFEIALSCTLRIAGRTVERIGLPEIRVGIFPGSGGTQRLGRLIGTHRARAFILRGAVIGAEQALSMGLVDEVAPSAFARAMELANELVGRSPAAVRAIMELTRTGDYDSGLRAEVLRFAALLKEYPDTLARLRAFVAGGEDLGGIP